MGYFRLALAIMITAAHAEAVPIVWAQGAVIVFYALSGYLAALSMVGSYRRRPWAFLCSRWLRVWPCYAVVFALSLTWLLWRGVPPMMAYGIPRLPNLLAQLAMWPVPVGSGLVVPPGWMLPRLFFWWLCLAFSPRWSGYGMVALSIPVLCVVPDYYGFPLAALAMGLGAIGYQGGVVLPRAGRWDAMAGTLSFPIFLCHALILGELSYRVPLGWPLFWFSIPPTLIVSCLLVRYVERPIARYRARLKTQQ